MILGILALFFAQYDLLALSFDDSSHRSIALENYSIEGPLGGSFAIGFLVAPRCEIPANRMSGNATHVDVTVDNLEIPVRGAYTVKALARKSVRQRALQRLTGVKIIGASASFMLSISLAHEDHTRTTSYIIKYANTEAKHTICILFTNYSHVFKKHWGLNCERRYMDCDLSEMH